MQRLDRRLQRSENAKRLRNKLQSDLESVSGSRVKRISSDETVFSDQTDGEFPLRKMFEDEPESLSAVGLPSAEYQTLDGVGMALLPADIVDEVPALLRAAQAGNVQQVRALLSLGASPSPRFPDGRTALHFCAIYDDAETAEALVKYGADVNVKDDKQRTDPFSHRRQLPVVWHGGSADANGVRSRKVDPSLAGYHSDWLWTRVYRLSRGLIRAMGRIRSVHGPRGHRVRG